MGEKSTNQAVPSAPLQAPDRPTERAAERILDHAGKAAGGTYPRQVDEKAHPRARTEFIHARTCTRFY